MCKALKLKQPTISHHLGLLRMGRFVSGTRQGKSVVYTADKKALKELAEAIGKVDAEVAAVCSPASTYVDPGTSCGVHTCWRPPPVGATAISVSRPMRPTRFGSKPGGRRRRNRTRSKSSTAQVGVGDVAFLVDLDLDGAVPVKEAAVLGVAVGRRPRLREVEVQLNDQADRTGDVEAFAVGAGVVRAGWRPGGTVGGVGAR